MKHLRSYLFAGVLFSALGLGFMFFAKPVAALSVPVVDTTGNVSQFDSSRDAPQLKWINPTTFTDGANGQTYRLNAPYCQGNNDGIYTCNGNSNDGAGGFEAGYLWYWPSSDGSAILTPVNGKCVTPFVVYVTGNTDAVSLLAVTLSAENINPTNSGHCYFETHDSNIHGGADFHFSDAQVQGKHSPSEDVGPNNNYTYQDNMSVGNQYNKGSRIYGIAINQTSLQAFATEFDWVDAGSIALYPGGTIFNYMDPANSNNTGVIQIIQSELASSKSGSVKKYQSGYNYYVSDSCIDRTAGKVTGFIAVNPSSPGTIYIVHDGNGGYSDDWNRDDNSHSIPKCMIDDNEYINSPAVLYGGSATTATIGIGDVANFAKQAGTGTPPAGSTSASTGGNTDPGLQCGMSNSELNWIICPVINIASDAAQGLDNWISSLLNADINQTFGSSYKAAWSTFRILATAILLIAGLIMVVSQAMGFEALDAYTVRKVLPRLLVAVIGVSLSWPLMKFVVEFFNVFGHDTYGLITGPFNTIGATVNPITGGLTSFLLVPIAGAVALFVFGPAALLMILSGLIGLFMAFAILVIRQIAITVMVIAAPIAIVCYILPNTQKVWNVWRENFLGLLMMYPIVMAFIAAGHAFAMVSLNHGGGISTIIGIIAYFIPYFLLPMAFRMATGAIGTIAGMVNDRSKGVFDRLKNTRHKAAEENMASFKQGFKRTRLGSNFESGKHQRIARREAWGSGAIGMGKRGTARYHTALENTEFGHLASATAESIKNNPSAAANDDANKIAQYAKDDKDFIRQYMASKPTATRQEAIDQLTYTEQAFGAAMGSKQMRHAAATAALSSNSSTDTVAERAAWMRQAVSDHVMTASQAAALVKQSGSLTSSAGFGDLLGAANGTLSDAELLKRATYGFNPANSHRMRKGQAQEMAQEVHRQAQSAAATYGTGSDEFAKAVADAAGIHDVMNGMTPEVREEFANYLNGATVAGKSMREHEQQMEATSNGAYLDRRKTWTSAAAGAGGGTPGVVPGGPTGGGGGTPGGGAGGAGGAPSDIRLKRHIVALYQTPGGIQLYRFKYLWSDQEYVGVMAQDLLRSHPEAVSRDEFGYYRVDYSKVGLRMMTIEEWEAAKAPIQSVR